MFSFLDEHCVIPQAWLDARRAGAWRTGWKVVRRYGCQFAKEGLHPPQRIIAQNIEEEEKIPWPERVYISAFGAQGCGRVLYRFEQPTRPEIENGPLAVFQSLAMASQFIRRHCQTAVAIRCLYKRSVKSACWVLDPVMKFISHNSVPPVPAGTDFADVVVLMRGENLLTCEVMG